MGWIEQVTNTGNTYDSESDAGTQTGLRLSNDGLWAFTTSFNGVISRFNLEAPGVIGDGTVFSGIAVDVSDQEPIPRDLCFSSDGMKLFTVGLTDTIREWSMPAPFDIENLVYTGFSFSTSAFETSPISIDITEDGLFIYILGVSGDGIDQLNLANPNTLQGATYSGFFLDVAGITGRTNPEGITLCDLDRRFIIVNGGGGIEDLFEFQLPNKADIRTATLVGGGSVLNLAGTVSSMDSIEFFNDSKMIVAGETGGINSFETLYEFDFVPDVPAPDFSYLENVTRKSTVVTDLTLDSLVKEI